MPRYLSRRHFYLSGKNKISIYRPCSTFSCCLLLLLLFVCCLHMLLLQLDQLGGGHSPPNANVAEDVDVDEALAQRVRVFCIIVTDASRHSTVAVHVKRTWARDCNQHLFISNDADGELEPAVIRNVGGKWQMMRAYLEYVHRYHFDEADWFLYANDDNFVVLDNLRYLLQAHSPEQPIYFGCKLKTANNESYMYDRSGIVLSRSAMRNLVLHALPNATICSPANRNYTAGEELARCLTNVNVTAGDSRDRWGNYTFLPFEDTVHLGTRRLNASLDSHKYILEHSYYELINQTMPVSVHSICYHAEYSPHIVRLYYFIHKVKIFGVAVKAQDDITLVRYERYL